MQILCFQKPIQVRSLWPKYSLILSTTTLSKVQGILFKLYLIHSRCLAITFLIYIKIWYFVQSSEFYFKSSRLFYSNYFFKESCVVITHDWSMITHDWSGFIFYRHRDHIYEYKYEYLLMVLSPSLSLVLVSYQS